MSVPHRWLAWLVGAAALVLGGCGGHSQEVAQTSTDAHSTESASRVELTRRQGHEARFLGAVDRRYDFAVPGITMTAPPHDRSADVSWRVAFDACFTGPVPCVAFGDAVVSLASVSGPGDAGTAPFGGRHMLEQVLTYVVTWDTTDCSRLATSESRPGADCRVVDLITAEKVGRLEAGSHVYAFVAPESAPVPQDPH